MLSRWLSARHCFPFNVSLADKDRVDTQEYQSISIFYLPLLLQLRYQYCIQMVRPYRLPFLTDYGTKQVGHQCQWPASWVPRSGHTPSLVHKESIRPKNFRGTAVLWHFRPQESAPRGCQLHQEVSWSFACEEHFSGHSAYAWWCMSSLCLACRIVLRIQTWIHSMWLSLTKPASPLRKHLYFSR